MTREKAKELAYAIFTYSELREEWGGEGNSGEFHNAQVSSLISKQLSKCFDRLSRVFEDLTSYSLHIDEEGDIFFDNELLIDPMGSLYNF